MSKWPIRGHFGHLHFKTFPMTARTPQCKVFWSLLSNSKHSGVPEDSKSPTLGVWVSSSHLAKVGLRQCSCKCNYYFGSLKRHVSHGPTLQVLGLGLGFFILPFIVCHMAAQQLLDLVTNANVVLRLKCATIVTCATRLVALTIALPILGFLTHLHLL
jgi:hypothetical protein